VDRAANDDHAMAVDFPHDGLHHDHLSTLLSDINHQLFYTNFTIFYSYNLNFNQSIAKVDVDQFYLLINKRLTTKKTFLLFFLNSNLKRWKIEFKKYNFWPYFKI